MFMIARGISAVRNISLWAWWSRCEIVFRIVSVVVLMGIPVFRLAAQSLTLRLENDIGFGDAGYTNGMRADLVTEVNESASLRWSIGQSIFTPKELEADTLSPDDRPYAGWLYLSAVSTFATHAMKSNRIQTSVGIDLGLVGPRSLAGDLQRWWHDRFNRPPPKGWTHQIPERFGFILNADLARSFSDVLEAEMDLNGQLHAGLKIGNIVNAVYYGMPIRFGWNAPDSAPTPIINSTSVRSPPVHPNRKWALYLSAMAEGSFVFYDYLIDGSDRHDVESTTARVDVVVGIGARLGRLSGSWHLVTTSPDFRPNGQWESFQTYSLTFEF